MTEHIAQPKSETLRRLYWRDEILQVLFWMQGEGLGEEADARVLERFLGVDATVIEPYLDVLVADGFLERSDHGAIRLSRRGHDDGARIFAEEFAELTRPGHGECGADCWCQSSPEEADACIEERLGGTRS